MSDDPETAILQDTRTSAVFSDDRKYRYRLQRTWDVEKPTLGFIMLNPSTADEIKDDNTIRRCIGYAKDWGYGKIVVGNLFALRAKDPNELYDHPDPVGPENNEHLEKVVDKSERVVAAWGAHGSLRDRGEQVARMFGDDLYALDTTKKGQPVHPLYQPGDIEAKPLDASEVES